MCYKFGGLIFGGAYFRNFTVYDDDDDDDDDEDYCYYYYNTHPIFSTLYITMISTTIFDIVRIHSVCKLLGRQCTFSPLMKVLLTY